MQCQSFVYCLWLMSKLRKLGLVVRNAVLFKEADAKALQQKLSGKGCQDGGISAYLSLIITEYADSL